jgi:hypothetical protein
MLPGCCAFRDTIYSLTGSALSRTRESACHATCFAFLRVFASLRAFASFCYSPNGASCGRENPVFFGDYPSLALRHVKNMIP